MTMNPIQFLAMTVLAIAAYGSHQQATTTSSWSDDKGDDFAILSADGSVYSNGSFGSADFDRYRKAKTDRILVRHEGKLFQITDPGTIKEARAAIQPVVALARKQGELGRQQGQLGRKQGELGRRQGQLGRKQGEFGRLVGQTVRMQMRDETRSAAESKMREIEEGMRGLAKQQTELGQKQSELGHRQSELGKKQSELGRQQGEASRSAGKKIRTLIEAAFEKRLAKPVSD